jgi:chitodextrinase
MNSFLRALALALALACPAFAQTEERLKITAITSSQHTGQDYTNWLNDDLDKLIPNAWQDNLTYVDVTLKLEKKARITRLSLYDFEGTFTDQPASIYALNGSTRTLIGTFDGRTYMTWVELRPTAPLEAEALVVHKFGNNIPQKIQIFGTPVPTTPPCTPAMSHLSDLAWASATSGWGPVEKDRANGEQAAGDGPTLRLNGKTYAKGIGAHAPSVITYTLGGTWSRFKADIGLDDSKDNSPGSIVFEVWADGQRLYQSGIMRAATATAQVDVDLTGRQRLELRVTDAGDGTHSDHGDWADARLERSCGGTPPPVADTQAPGVPGNVRTGSVSQTSLTLSWDASTDNVGVTGYDVYQGSTLLGSVTGTSYNVTGLTGGTQYTFSVRAKDAAGNVSTPGSTSVTTAAPATTPPPAGGCTPTTTYLSDLSWTSAENGWGPVERDRANGENNAGDGPALKLGTKTYAKGLGVHSRSEVSYALGGAYTRFKADIGLADYITEFGSVVFEVFIDGTKAYESGLMTPGQVKAVDLEVTGKQQLRLVVTNADGRGRGDHANWADARLERTCAAPVADTQAPGVPGNVRTGSVSQTSLTLSWDASTDNVGVTGYDLYQGSTLLGSVTGTSYNVTGLTAGTAYTFSVRAKDAAGNVSPPGSTTTTTASATPPPGGTGTEPVQAGKIPLDPARWYQLNNVSQRLDKLFDGRTDETVEVGWGLVLPSHDAYYRLEDGEEMTITGVRFYDGAGIIKDKPLTLSVITSDWQRRPIATFTGEQYNAWVGPDPANPGQFSLPQPVTGARYLVIHTWGGFPTELELLGTHRAPAARVAVPTRAIRFNDLLSVNGFEWDLLDPTRPEAVDPARLAPLAQTFTGLRHYLDWPRIEAQPGAFTFAPAHFGGWNYDALYESLKSQNLSVLLCLKTLPDWLLESYPPELRDKENTPLPFGADPARPDSYRLQARAAFQLAARYGRPNPALDPALVTVDARLRWPGDTPNTPRRGLDLIRYLECDNERDKWWKGRKAYQTAREYAANLSAFYDGHQGTLGPGYGVKNADPTMRVVMGGLALPSTDYLRGMIDWCRQHRGYRPDGRVDVCWDIVNYHQYFDTQGSAQSNAAGRGAAPERSTAAQTARAFVAIAHHELGDMPVWLSETGYDTEPTSPLRAMAIGSKSVEAVRAEWTLRSALLAARTGLSRIDFYQLYEDFGQKRPGQFGSMGLLTPQRRRTPAADFLLQARQLLEGYVFRQTLQEDPLVDRYEKEGRSLLVLTVPDEQDRKATVTVDLGTATAADVYTPRIGAATMSVTRVPVSQGKLTLTATETPTFVVPVPGGSTRTAGTDSVSLAARPTDAETLRLDDLRVFPNPAQESLAFQLRSAHTGPVEVRIYDARGGRTVLQTQVPKTEAVLQGAFDIRALPTGLFQLEIRQGTQRVTRTFTTLR